MSEFVLCSRSNGTLGKVAARTFIPDAVPAEDNEMAFEPEETRKIIDPEDIVKPSIAKGVA